MVGWVVAHEKLESGPSWLSVLTGDQPGAALGGPLPTLFCENQSSVERMISSVTKYKEPTANLALRLNKPKSAADRRHPVGGVGVFPGADGSAPPAETQCYPSYQTQVKIAHQRSSSVLSNMPR
jgi:hypothetical protein